MPVLPRRRFPFGRLVASLLVIFGLSISIAVRDANAGEAAAATRIETGPTVGLATGRKLPRYASLKFKETNLRVGPGTKYGVSWTYGRKGMPVEIIQEFDNWRRIRDVEGTTGWVLHSLLSNRRTAIVAPWRRGFEAKAGADLAALALLNGKGEASADARTVARFQPGLQVGVEGCDAGWCAVEVKSVKAYLKQDKLWGVYEDEEVGG